MGQKLHIETFSLSDWMTNCYVLHPPEAPEAPEAATVSPEGGVDASRECWIVDAGFELGPLIAYVREKELTPSAVLVTHAHVDHIAGLEGLRSEWPSLPILVHPAEHAALLDPMLNLSGYLGQELTAPAASGNLEEGQLLTMAGLEFAVLHTPGHSPGSVTLYQPEEGVAFVGDALFLDSVGRTDFPNSDHRTLIHSIKEKLLTLPDGTRVLSGHGPETTIGRERRHNPFLV